MTEGQQGVVLTTGVVLRPGIVKTGFTEESPGSWKKEYELERGRQERNV